MGDSKQYRIFTGVLYPDSKSYDYRVILKVLGVTFDEFAYISHDADIDSDGKPKKVHVHWLGRLKNPTTIGGISFRTTLPAHDIEAGKSFKALVRYLIHEDDPDKAQYDASSVTANFDLTKYLCNGKVSDAEKAAKLLQFIIDTHCTSMLVLMDWALKNDCWDALRRGGSLFRVCQAEMSQIEG